MHPNFPAFSLSCCSLPVGLSGAKQGNVGWSRMDLLPIQTKLDRRVGQMWSPIQKELLVWQTLLACHVSKQYFFFCKLKHVLAAVQVRLNYLQILGDLKMYNGRIFNATLMVRVLFIYFTGFWSNVLLPCFMHLLWQCTGE